MPMIIRLTSFSTIVVNIKLKLFFLNKLVHTSDVSTVWYILAKAKKDSQVKLAMLYIMMSQIITCLHWIVKE